MTNMKAEEIEQLAEEFLTLHQEGSKVYHVKIREAIEFAYTQCQENMQTDIDEFEQKFSRWLHQNYKYSKITDSWHSIETLSGTGWAYGNLNYLKEKFNKLTPKNND